MTHPTLTHTTTSQRVTLDDIEAADLRGRGGAAFPVAAKIRSVLRAVERTGKRPVLIANGTESDPFAAKDRYLLSTSPETVLEGMAVIAGLIGVQEIHLVVPAELVDVVAPVAGRGGVVVDEAARGFVAGQDSAVAARVDGAIPIPRRAGTHVTDDGAWHRPTYVGNVETMHLLGLMSRREDPFARSLVSVSSGRLQQGQPSLVTVHDVPGSTTVRSLMRQLPEVMATHGTTAVPVLFGGMHGRWLGPDDDQLVGSRALFIPGRGVSVEEVTSQVLHAAAAASAGQCAPCVFGLPKLAENWDAWVCSRDRGRNAEAELALAQLTGTVRPVRGGHGPLAGRGACSHPDGAVALALSARKVVNR